MNCFRESVAKRFIRWPRIQKTKCGTKKELSIGFKRFEIGTKMGSFYANLEAIHFLKLEVASAV